MKRRNGLSKKFSAKEYVQKGFYENSKNIGNILASKGKNIGSAQFATIGWIIDQSYIINKKSMIPERKDFLSKFCFLISECIFLRHAI